MPAVWEVFRHHRLLTNDDSYHRRALAFIQHQGLAAQRIKAEWVIIQSGEFYELHVSEFVLDGSGKFTMDYARNEPVTVPVIISLGRVEHGPCWPEPGKPFPVSHTGSGLLMTPPYTGDSDALAGA